MDTKMIKDLVEWLKSLIEVAAKDETILYSLFEGTENEPYAIAGGWDNGYGNLDGVTCNSKEAPDYAMCVKIIINDGPWAYNTFEFLNMPYDKETGEVDNTCIALEWEDNLEELALWLATEWERIMKENT